MIEFLLGLAIGLAVGSSDAEPVPYKTITYSDSGRVVKVYRSDAFADRYRPNALAIGWNTNCLLYTSPSPRDS